MKYDVIFKFFFKKNIFFSTRIFWLIWTYKISFKKIWFNRTFNSLIIPFSNCIIFSIFQIFIFFLWVENAISLVLFDFLFESDLGHWLAVGGALDAHWSNGSDQISKISQRIKLIFWNSNFQREISNFSYFKPTF